MGETINKPKCDVDEHYAGKYGPCVIYVKRRSMSEEYGTNLVHVYAVGTYIGHFVEMGWMENSKNGIYRNCTFAWDRSLGCYVIRFGKDGLICSRRIKAEHKTLIVPAIREKNELGEWHYRNCDKVWQELFQRVRKNKWRVTVKIEGDGVNDKQYVEKLIAKC